MSFISNDKFTSNKGMMTKSEFISIMAKTKIIYRNLYSLHNQSNEQYALFKINNLVFNKPSKFHVTFKENISDDYFEEYLKRGYKVKESKERLPKFHKFYDKYNQFYCSPFITDFNFNAIIRSCGEDKAEEYYKKNYPHENLTESNNLHIQQKEKNKGNKTSNKLHKKEEKLFTSTIRKKINEDSMVDSSNFYNNKESNIEKELSNFTLNEDFNQDKSKLNYTKSRITSNESTVMEIINNLQKEKKKKNLSIYLKRSGDEPKKNNTKTLREKFQKIIKKGILSKNNFSSSKNKNSIENILKNSGIKSSNKKYIISSFKNLKINQITNSKKLIPTTGIKKNISRNILPKPPQLSNPSLFSCLTKNIMYSKENSYSHNNSSSNIMKNNHLKDKSPNKIVLNIETEPSKKIKSRNINIDPRINSNGFMNYYKTVDILASPNSRINSLTKTIKVDDILNPINIVNDKPIQNKKILSSKSPKGNKINLNTKSKKNSKLGFKYLTNCYPKRERKGSFSKSTQKKSSSTVKLNAASSSNLNFVKQHSTSNTEIIQSNINTEYKNRNKGINLIEQNKADLMKIALSLLMESNSRENSTTQLKHKNLNTNTNINININNQININTNTKKIKGRNKSSKKIIHLNTGLNLGTISDKLNKKLNTNEGDSVMMNIKANLNMLGKGENNSKNKKENKKEVVAYKEKKVESTKNKVYELFKKREEASFKVSSISTNQNITNSEKKKLFSKEHKSKEINPEILFSKSKFLKKTKK